MRYLLYSEPTDMRKSYHTLSGLVTNNMGLNVRNGDVFIFVNKPVIESNYFIWNPVVLLSIPNYLKRVAFASPQEIRRRVQS
jgi:transposase